MREDEPFTLNGDVPLAARCDPEDVDVALRENVPLAAARGGPVGELIARILSGLRSKVLIGLFILSRTT